MHQNDASVLKNPKKVFTKIDLKAQALQIFPGFLVLNVKVFEGNVVHYKLVLSQF